MSLRQETNLVIGNCQAPILSKFLNAACDYSNQRSVSFLLHKDSGRLLSSFESQPSTVFFMPFRRIRDTPNISSENLDQLFPDARLVPITNAYFEGSCPFWGYFYDSKHKKCYPSWDDYVNFFMVIFYRRYGDHSSYPSESLFEAYSDLLVRVARLCWDRSLSELRLRESNSSSISNVSGLIDRIGSEQPLFWTFNHPRRTVIDYVCASMFQALTDKRSEYKTPFGNYEPFRKSYLPGLDLVDKNSDRKIGSFSAIFRSSIFSFSKTFDQHLSFLSRFSLLDIDCCIERYLADRPEMSILLNTNLIK